MTQSTSTHSQSNANGTDDAPLQLYAFDFDGTITTRDTFALFIRYYAGTPLWLFKLFTLTPSFLAYALKLKHRNDVKRDVCRKFFKGQPLSRLNDEAEQFAADVIPQYVRPAAIKYVQDCLEQERELMIVSASIEHYLIPWARSHNIQTVIATQLEVTDGRLTGELKGENCWGDGKTRAIAAQMGQTPYEIAEAFGDSQGDKPMLVAAKASFWRPFRL